MADVVRSLRFVAVSDQYEVDRLDLLTDDTVRGRRPGATAESAVASRVRHEGETPAEAFRYLAANGWSNGNTMIKLDDLDKPGR